MKHIKNLKMWQKIFICLITGIIFGIVLSTLGGTEVAWIAKVCAFSQFLGNIFIRLIKMVVVPLVLFSIVSAVAELKDLKRLRSIGIKTLLIFTVTSAAAITIGVGMAYLIKPGTGINLEGVTNSLTVAEPSGVYDTILDMIPTNIFEALTSGNMLQIIVFSIFVGIALILLGEKGEKVQDAFKTGADVIYKVVDIVIKFTPIAVFGLMTNAMAVNGVAVLGNIMKFIMTHYIAATCQILLIYIPLLVFIAKVNPIKFFKVAFESWLLGFSTCASMAVLPVSLKNATKRMGIPNEAASFILPFGATANMDGTGIFLGIVVVFASQIAGVELTFAQLAALIIEATLLSIGCAAVPQMGLVIATSMITTMGLPVAVIGLVAGVYRIIDQMNTATNSTGDLVVATCVSASEGILDRSVYDDDFDGSSAMNME
ncbi:MAG: dicarboxylate/amino acid:cation symporter [bacterium]|nr:dicarboxylate/amino acid:cation symporter [bacterium]